MKKLVAYAVGAAIALTIAFYAGRSAQAADNVAPVRLDRSKIAGLGLTAIGPEPYKDILEAGELNMRVSTLFSGQDLNIGIFESTPARTNHKTRPTTEDEFVYVVSGKLILTEPTGTKHEFLEGDTLVLPAGYTGTWEMQGNYREIAITPSRKK